MTGLMDIDSVNVILPNRFVKSGIFGYDENTEEHPMVRLKRKC